MIHRSLTELEAALDEIRQSPKESGTVQLIVRRPEENAREVLEEGQLSLEEGLVGDMWQRRPCRRSTDGTAHPDMQLNLMNVRAIDLIAGERDRWHLAGDQLFVDLDLSDENLPPGTRLSLGSAVIEVTDQPHTGCFKFQERFGADALKFVNSPIGKELNLRGINAKVIQAGTVRPGDSVSRV